jgi:uncharacterized membrane protein YkvA (DUF1232 family)
MPDTDASPSRRDVPERSRWGASSAEPPALRGRLRRWASAARRDVRALALAVRDPRVPWYAKALAAATVAYALSPIDLIPDFVPVLGYLDDLILVPLGLLAAVRLIPPDVMADLRRRAEETDGSPSSRRAGAVVVVGVWVLALTAGAWAAAEFWQG